MDLTKGRLSSNVIDLQNPSPQQMKLQHVLSILREDHPADTYKPLEQSRLRDHFGLLISPGDFAMAATTPMPDVPAPSGQTSFKPRK